MKFIIGVIAALLTVNAQAAVEACTGEVRKDGQVESMALPLEMYQHPEADIVGYVFDGAVGSYNVHILLADGNYIINADNGVRSGSVTATDSAAVLALGDATETVIISCPSPY